MKYDSVTLDCFAANNAKLKKKDKTLSIYLQQDHDTPGIILKNVEFVKNKQYVIHINIILMTDIHVFFYSTNNDVYNVNNKTYMVNGKNRICINVRHNNIMDIGFLVSNPKINMSFSVFDIMIINKIYDMDNKKINNLINTHFNNNVGFGKYKDIAIELLKETIQILDEFSIDYFLISGTLLGYIRHNDFIPWDDDIDLIVDASILDKLADIEKCNNIKFVSSPSCKWIMKSCYEKRIILDNDQKIQWPPEYNWTWPFIDLFIFGYDTDKRSINFFNKKWDISNFFPKSQVFFLGISVSIPCNPDYFLKINYGSDYMIILKSSNYCHKEEKGIGMTIQIHNKLLKYNSNI